MGEKAITTLKDLARLAGVSAMTVSLALRDRPGVSEAMRRKIKTLAKKTGYRRDPLLSALSARRKGSKRHQGRIAYVGAWRSGDFSEISYNRQFFQGAAEAGKELGYDLETYWLDPSLPLNRHGDILYHRGFDGLLIAPVDEGCEELDMDWSRFAAVALGRSLRSPALNFASANHYGGLCLVCRELLALGYRRLGLAMRSDTNVRTQGRWVGAILEWNLASPPGMRIPPLIYDGLGKKVFQAWVRREKPDVVISLGDRPLRWLPEMGLSIPDDIGYVLLERMEDIPGQPAFSALDQNFADVGRAALKLLHSDIATGFRGVPAIRSSLLIDGTWVQGERVRNHGSPQ